MTTTNTRKNENFEYCKNIAEEIENIIDRDCYKCPHCGKIHTFDEYEINEHESSNGVTCYTCPNCGEEIEEDELEAFTLWDYFEDALDIEYTVGSDKQYRSVRIMVCCGGPNVYVDTGRGAVILNWWTEHAEYMLLNETCEAIDDVFEELYNCC